MPKRSQYRLKGEGQKLFYKINLPIYVSVEMVEGLSKLSKESQTEVINDLLRIVAHTSENYLGHGSVREDQLEMFVDNDDNVVRYQTGSDREFQAERERDDRKEGKSWNVPDHLLFGK